MLSYAAELIILLPVIAVVVWMLCEVVKKPEW